MWRESMETPHTCFSNAIMLTFLLLNLTLETVVGADTYNRDDFPADFVFGSGTSAYQVEGAANEEGRSDSIWDTFAHAGHGHGGNGDVACDGYHKYNEDVRLMVDTGLEAYRFSISWSRLLPNGRGPVNPKGLQYYNNLINQLISNGIQPHVSLHHYDLPQVLEDEYGGWVSRDIIRDFTYYADVCFREFGDRVLYWTTVSEPNVFSVGGYDQGTCPPQRCSPPFCFIKSNRGNSTYEPYLAIHHILLAHSSVVRLYRRKYWNKQHGFVGISIFLFGLLPQTNTEKDRAATQRVRDFLVGWVMEPLQYGDYPISMKKNAGERIPAFTTRESEQLKGSFDFIGLIYYTNVNITDNSDVLKNQLRDFGADMAANTSQRTPSNSSLQDVSRVKYLHEYIGGVLDALRDGVNIKGYFSWSFMDLYELLEGYEATYGLYYVDRDDPELKRHPKLSAKWYSRFLKNRSTSIVGIVELEKDPSLVSIGHLFE